MQWWREYKAKKNFLKYHSEAEFDSLKEELVEGEKAARAVRDEMRKQESPEYVKLIGTLNAVKAGTAPDEQKYLISMKLIESSTLIDRERNDLLQQIDLLYNRA